MFYSIKISSESCDPIQIDEDVDTGFKDALEKLSISIDTVEENVSDRAARILNRVTLVLKVNPVTKIVCDQLMEWSLTSSGEDVYRTVNIDISDSRKDIVRSYELHKMFVEDYTESFDGKEQAIATLKLIQMANYAQEFKHSWQRL